VVVRWGGWSEGGMGGVEQVNDEVGELKGYPGGGDPARDEREGERGGNMGGIVGRLDLGWGRNGVRGEGIGGGGGGEAKARR